MDCYGKIRSENANEVVGSRTSRIGVEGKLLFLGWKRYNRVVSGRSAVRLAHLVWVQGVAGSNPAAPTINEEIERGDNR